MNFARDIKNRVVNYIARKFLKLKHISYRIIYLSAGARYPAVEGGAADALEGAVTRFPHPPSQCVPRIPPLNLPLTQPLPVSQVLATRLSRGVLRQHLGAWRAAREETRRLETVTRKVTQNICY